MLHSHYNEDGDLLSDVRYYILQVTLLIILEYDGFFRVEHVNNVGSSR
jgi:hypothetical protein